MANVVNRKDKKRLELEYYTKLKKTHFLLTWLGVGVLLLAPFFIDYFTDLYVFISCVLVVTMLIFYNILSMLSAKRKSMKLEDFNTGEDIVSEELNGLPEDFLVLNNLQIKSGQEIIQVDHVVIGKNAVYAIETRLLPGLIIGKEQSPYWLQRYSKKNNFIENQIDNPILKAKRIAQAVHRYLEVLTGRSFGVKPLVVVADKTNKLHLETITPIIRCTYVNQYIIEEENKRHKHAS